MSITYKIKQAQSAQELIELLYEEWENLNPGDLAFLISQMGGFVYRAKLVKNPNDKQYFFCQSELKSMNALAHNQEFLKLLIEKFNSFLPMMDLRNLSLAARGIATLGFFPSETFMRLGDDVIKTNFKGYIPKNLINLMHAFDIQKMSHPNLFSAITKILLDTKFKDFSLEDIMNIIASYAKRRHEDPKLYQGFIQKILTFDLKELNEKTLCHLAWSLAKTNIEKIESIDTKPLLESLSSLALKMKISSFQPYNVARLSWALGKLGFFNKSLFEEIALYTSTYIYDFEISEMVNVIWGFAKLGIRNEGVILKQLQKEPYQLSLRDSMSKTLLI